MKYIIPADQTIVTLLGEQKLSEKNNVRKSCFSISVDVDNGRLLYNTLTNECVFISENEVDTEIEDCLFKKYFLV
ncbi:MAG: hypothetical protein IJR86_08320, partial [Bacteroidaceae bacterium]|nr:hypothetical protein [Bacteroidaceae bacterium]